MEHREAELHWDGPRTVQALAARLEAQGAVALSLAPDLHHSLFVRLRPDAGPGEPEQLDLSGGAELLSRVAAVAGLERLAELVPALAAAQAEVRVESPAPTLYIRLPGSA